MVINDKCYYISLSNATYMIQVENDFVTRCPPIAKWMKGLSWETYVRPWLLKRNATITEIE